MSDEQDAAHSPSSPTEASDTATPVVEAPEPKPGLDGIPVRCECFCNVWKLTLELSVVKRVRCKCCARSRTSCLLWLMATSLLQADRTEPYTRITPFQEKHDTSVEYVSCSPIWQYPHIRDLKCRFFYKPITLSALGAGMAILAYVATTQDVLEEGRDKRRVSVLFGSHSGEFC